jgi:hypothetical protein
MEKEKEMQLVQMRQLSDELETLRVANSAKSSGANNELNKSR